MRGNRTLLFTAGRCQAVIALLMFAAGMAGGETAERCFTILHTNDEHSALLPTPYADYHPEEDNPSVGGFARLGRVIGDIRLAKSEAGEPVIVTSAGDVVGGSPYMWLIPDGEAPELTLMRRIGYDVVTIGNHDFDYGPEVLAQYYRTAANFDTGHDIAIVSSNLVIPEGHPLGDCGILDTHVVVLDNGLRLGFFGLLGKDAAKLAAVKAPIEISDPVTAARTAVQRLRNMGAEVVIGVTHAGFPEDEAVAKAVPGIDIMLTGHFHQMVMDPPMRVGQTIFAQSSAYTQQLGVLELAFNPVSGTLRVRNEETGQPFHVTLDAAIENDPEIEQALGEYTEKLNSMVSRLTGGAVAHIQDMVLHTDFALRATAGRESILGNFVTDAMRLVVSDKIGEKVDFAIQANGVLRGDVKPGTMPYSLNQINFYDLASSIGLGTGYDGTPGYPLASIYLTGNEIYRMLELSLLLASYADVFFLQLSGGRFSYDPSRLVLFELPFSLMEGARMPVPSFRAVRTVERFTGSGPQGRTDDAYQPVSRGDKTLYHVVCDAYILSFFPRIADMFPVYKVIPKDRHGNPIVNRDAIIHSGGGELKFWQAVVAYALSQPPGEDGLPAMPNHYARTGSRIIQVKAYPLVLWTIPVLMLLIFCVYTAWRIIKRRISTGEIQIW